jgi:porphobilinogen synthase
MSTSPRLDLPHRPRRLRRSFAIRAMLAETTLRTSDLIAPLFVIDGDSPPEAIASLPGQFRLSIPDLVQECAELYLLGIKAVALFPKIDSALKDPHGTEELNEDGLILRAVRAVKATTPALLLITDVALDPYTSHGHDGLLHPTTQEVENDSTVARLAAMAVRQARAGVDFVAPSDMMDGRVAAIRAALDAASFTETSILAYSVKFNSAYYGPFREAVGSAHAAGTPALSKATYQLDPANRRAALIEAAHDEAEGADIIMVKPAGPYLDIIRDVRERSHRTIAAYQVSGEYAQIHAAARLGWLNLERTRDESLLAIKRAGADLILTYFAKDIARSQA